MIMDLPFLKDKYKIWYLTIDSEECYWYVIRIHELIYLWLNNFNLLYFWNRNLINTSYTLWLFSVKLYLKNDTQYIAVLENREDDLSGIKDTNVQTHLHPCAITRVAHIQINKQIQKSKIKKAEEARRGKSAEISV